MNESDAAVQPYVENEGACRYVFSVALEPARSAFAPTYELPSPVRLPVSKVETSDHALDAKIFQLYAEDVPVLVTVHVPPVCPVSEVKFCDKTVEAQMEDEPPVKATGAEVTVAVLVTWQVPIA